MLDYLRGFCVKQIRPVISTVNKICGEQIMDSSLSYRVSQYCLSTNVDKGVLLYHTFTGELVLLSNQEEIQTQKDFLIGHRFFVPEDFDEQKYIDDVISVVRLIQPQSKKKIDFTILTTTDCNARCFYCYEIGIRRIFMSPETAHQVAEYIIRVSDGKPVKLRWFGGEPLYNLEAINIICKILRTKNTEFESSLVSNGFYLDERTINQACDLWNLKKVQITIDGTEETYNRTKAYIDADKNPYQRVMHHIELAMNAGIHVTIRMNMDAQNASDLLKLAEDIARRFPDLSNLEVYIALLQDFGGSIHEYESLQIAEESFYAIKRKLSDLGLLRKKILPQTLKLSKCMADNDLTETVLPDGRVGRCEHFGEDMITGNIQMDQRDKEVEEKWKKPLNVPECRECGVYPICHKLKMCKWNRHGCSELDRKIIVDEVKDNMISTYRAYVNGGKSK